MSEVIGAQKNMLHFAKFRKICLSFKIRSDDISPSHTRPPLNILFCPSFFEIMLSPLPCFKSHVFEMIDALKIIYTSSSVINHRYLSLRYACRREA